MSGRAGTHCQRGHRGQSEREDHRKGGIHGYDGAKKVNGRKRHLLVDTLGIVCKIYVSAADIGDRDGAAVLLTGLDGSFPRLAYGWVD